LSKQNFSGGNDPSLKAVKKNSLTDHYFWKISLQRCENFINFNELTNPFPCIYQILSIPKIIVV